MLNTWGERVFTNDPQVPFDIQEATYIDNLLNKIPLYQKKIAELAIEIQRLAKDASDITKLSYSYEIE